MSGGIVTTRASVWRGGSQIAVETLRLKRLRPEQVRIRVEAADINSTDAITLGPIASEWADPLPQVLGHAIAGIIEEIGSAVTLVNVGDRVVANNTPECGVCWYCVNDEANQCAAQQLVGPAFATTEDGEETFGASYVGGFAEIAVMAENQVFPVEADVSSAALALIACGYGSGLGAALRSAPITPGSTALAVGLGTSGLGFVQGAKLANAACIIGVDRIASRRARALEMGATHVVDPDAVEDVVAAVWEIGPDRGGLQGKGADFAFEGAADAKAMSQAFDMVRVGGSLVLSSLPHEVTANLELPAVFAAVWSKRVQGSNWGNMHPRRDFSWASKLVERGDLDPAALLDRTYSLEQVPDAVADIRAHAVVGATILPQN